MTTGRKLGFADHAIGASLSLLYLMLLLGTSRDLGMNRDEGFYVDAAESYGHWLELAWEDRDRAMEQAVVDQYWGVNHEHPSLPKALFALSWLADEAWDIYPQASMAYRFPGMVMSSLLLWLLYVFGARAYGRQVGAFAAVCWALMPRVFYHAHLDCFDVPIVLMLTWVTYCYWRSLAEPRWALMVGLSYGLALETKHNAWLLPIVLLIHWLCFVVPGEIGARRAGRLAVVSVVPWWLIAMIAMGPAIFVALWPWLWHDTWARFQEYVAFHGNHVHYNMAYLGTTYFREPLPVSYPFGMTLFTLPLVVIVLALAGIALRFRAMLPPGFATHLWPEGAAQPDRQRTDALIFGTMLAPIVVIALPWTPIFGGVKHFIAGWAMLSLFAGIAFVQVARALRSALRVRQRTASRATRVVTAAALLAPAAVGTVHSHPFGLSYYGFAAGGVPGAADLGMNRQYWGFTTGSLAPWLNERMPNGGSVWVCDTTFTAWRVLQRDGLVRDDIRASYDIGSADYAIVHHEDHFVEVDYQIWMHYGRVDPVYVLTYDGVPIISVYENPRRRR